MLTSRARMPSSSDGKEQGTGNNCAIGRVRMEHGGYAGGDLIHLSESGWHCAHGLIGRFAATEAAGDDLVFALHGSTDYLVELGRPRTRSIESPKRWPSGFRWGANDRCRRTTSFTISGCRPIGRLLTGVISGNQ